jgi:hypothetical protein
VGVCGCVCGGAGLARVGEWVVLVSVCVVCMFCVCVCRVCVCVCVCVDVCVFPRSHLLTLSTEDSQCSRTAGFSPSQEISPFYGTRMFITVLTTARHSPFS